MTTNLADCVLMKCALAAATCALTISCTPVPAPSPPPQLQPSTSSSSSYLPPDKLPDSSTLLPPPPEPNSEAFKLDEHMSRVGLALRDTEAWNLAVLDANLNFPAAAATFSCAVKAPITEAGTPHLYALLARVMNSAGDSTASAKNKYHRTRPFMVNQHPLCTPAQEDDLKKNGSYPSGHNAIGMAWALVMAELSPADTDAVLARGQAFGLSRIVCNAHWYSDTLQGRYMAAYTVARLHADKSFLDDLEAAKRDLKAAQASGKPPNRDCREEQAGMAEQAKLWK